MVGGDLGIRSQERRIREKVGYRMHARCKANKEGEKVDVVEQGEAGAFVDETGRGEREDG